MYESLIRPAAEGDSRTGRCFTPPDNESFENVFRTVGVVMLQLGKFENAKVLASLVVQSNDEQFSLEPKIS